MDLIYLEGQLEAIQNFVLGKSTILILPTGAGKSLCYQEEFLFEAELSRMKPQELKSKEVRVNTRLLYQQTKFNLLREESEGYVKLVTLLCQGSLDSTSNNSLAVTISIIKSLIGHFDLDPNRVFDIVLDCFELYPEKKIFYDLIPIFAKLPALILPWVTLAVSPLLTLMVDQLKKMPPVLPGGLLSSNQTSEESLETLNRLRSGEIKMQVLFVSPERFLNSEFLSVFEDNLTTSLVVIDESHCISEWSHNFRPSYLRVKASLLAKKLNVKCILAMTATATSETLDSIMNSLEILPNNLIQKSQIRANLQLSISSSENKSKDLLVLLKSSPFVGMKSIIVYCNFQVVATVAFGMGLDKSDVEGVRQQNLNTAYSIASCFIWWG